MHIGIAPNRGIVTIVNMNVFTSVYIDCIPTNFLIITANISCVTYFIIVPDIFLTGHLISIRATYFIFRTT